MLRIRYTSIIAALGLTLLSATSSAQVSIGIGLPNISIGINIPVYPEFVVVPGYPVYYAPQMEANFFFYDGMYWVYQDDGWYASTWYNGPWWFMNPEAVPVFLLRIPVRYYRQPPVYFYGWMPDAPPRWGDHWGRDWEQHRHGWDRWNRSAAPAPAPLPVYQRQYSGDKYPQPATQQQLLEQNYRYRPRDPVVRQHLQKQTVQSAPAQQDAPAKRSAKQLDIQRSKQLQQDGSAGPRMQRPQRGGENVQRLTPASPGQGRQEVQDSRQPPQPGMRRQQSPGSQDPQAGQQTDQQGRDATREPKQKKVKKQKQQGQEQEHEKGQNRNQ